MEIKNGNEECKKWFNSEEYLKFDFIGLKMDEKFMNLEKMYKNRNENSEESFKLYKDSLEILKDKNIIDNKELVLYDNDGNLSILKHNKDGTLTILEY